MLKLTALSVVLFTTALMADVPCAQRQMKFGNVCVCNATFCDTVPKIKNLSSNEYQLYSTSKDNMGFHSATGTFAEKSSSQLTVSVPDLTARKQSILGFGGAFTGSACYNILQLPEALQNNLLESYFGEDGIRYTVNRVVMGAADFSTHPYSNVDIKDESLESWALQDEDNWRIEVINKAAKLRGKDELKLFISSWSSPRWMKTEDRWNGTGQLKPEYYQTWADYFLKYLRVYKENGVEFWGVTAQNEPFTSPVENINLKWSYATMNEWLVKNFGPTIRNSEFKDLKIMILDDDTYLMPGLKGSTLNNASVLEYADGISIHWYTNSGNQESYWQGIPSDMFILATEACQDVANCLHENKVELGNWDRGTNYIKDILYDLEHNFIGWVEWNLALDLNGGPSWMHASLDSPIIVNFTGGEFYKEPMFYVVGHFSKFIVPGSVKVQHEISAAATQKGIKTIAFVLPDGKVAVHLANTGKEDITVDVTIEKAVQAIKLDANSVNTLLYKP